MLKRGLEVSHPGGLLRRELVEVQGLKIKEIAGALKMSRVSVSNVLNEKAAISPEMALKLSIVFGSDPSLWLSLQADYDLEQTAIKFKKLKISLGLFDWQKDEKFNMPTIGKNEDYRTQGSFSKAFRKMTGQTPENWKKATNLKAAAMQGQFHKKDEKGKIASKVEKTSKGGNQKANNSKIKVSR